ncbi:hypothetical protein [Xylella taiwanensis]|uniref:Uncharacterized protein n=1 Tax=Xylella taiwanensis TaxID=1444770 RepID=Z9JN47_9GAMM|nr:hypothetical protein [Xylella taiwanensis]EWS79428.1 hypothetical protein AF72_00220 [Xylella taiwanensis]MCD8455451.1 hypothetical protein [Xylella taiwanensis]MCD8463948.1 hypothetical protein [Xylella taiwanensis]UFS52722.1 hypothetical protein LPH56_04815 [Xylella taiwanensis]
MLHVQGNDGTHLVMGTGVQGHFRGSLNAYLYGEGAALIHRRVWGLGNLLLLSTMRSMKGLGQARNVANRGNCGVFVFEC